MARRAQVRYWQRGTWYDEQGNAHVGGYWCTLKGVQHQLALGPDDQPKQGPTYLAALDRYRELLELENAPHAKDGNTVAVIFELYLDWFENTKRPKPSTNTLYARRFHLLTFAKFRPTTTAKRYGELQVKELDYAAVEAFVKAMREERVSAKAKRKRPHSWGDTMVHSFMTCLHAALNWAAKPGRKLITANPLKGLDRPTPRSRSASSLISPGLHEQIMAGASAELRHILMALENTGARPEEIVAATAADWNDDLGALVYLPDDRRLPDSYSHKNARKGKDRVIFFTGPALDMMRQLVRERPSGPLFRNRRGTAWRVGKLDERFQRLRDKFGAKVVTPYSYRHTWITNALNAGMPMVHVAELVGNTPEIIARHYSHVDANKKHLRGLAEQLHQQQDGRFAPVAAAVALLQEHMRTGDEAKLREAADLLLRLSRPGACTESPPAVLPFAPSAIAVGG
jgi:integrase